MKKEVQAPKYITLWKDGRLVFLRREEFERQSFWQKIKQKLRQLIRR
jgi:hypothetical protein